MSNEPPAPTEDHAAMRAAIRRDMLRTSTAVGVVLFIVLVLALVVVLSGARATRNLRRAERAETEGIERLWHSYLEQAQAVRLTAEAGRRPTALTAISNAAAIRTTTELRTEAVASLALTDLIREDQQLPVPREADQAEMDMALERFAYGDAQGNVFVARLTDGAKLISLEARDLGPGTRMPVRSTAFSPDGKKLAVRFAGGALVVWNLETQKRIIASGVNATNVIIAGMSFLSGPERVAFSDADQNAQISVYDLATGNRLTTAIRAGARTFRFRPGSMQLAVATDNKIDLIDYPAEKVLRTLTHATLVYTHAWSPDGKRLAVTCEDGDIYLWDIEHNSHRLLRGHSEPCVRLGFSGDGKLLFSGSRDGTTRLWDTSLGQTIVMSNDGVAHIFSPDGKRLGFWKLGVAFGAWRVERSDCYSLLACPKGDGAFQSLDLSPGGRWCLAGQSKGFRVWDLQAGEKESFFPVSDLNSVRISTDEKAIYICSPRGIEVRTLAANIAPGESLAFTATNTIPLPDSLGARNVALSADAKTAVVELSDLRCAILDLSGERAPLILKDRWRSANPKGPGSETGAGRFAISPDGKWLATGFWFGAKDVPKVWDTRTGELVATPQAGTSLVTFSADGKWLGLAGVGQFSVWSVGDWERKATILRDEMSYTHGAMAFAGDSDHIAFTRTRQLVQLRDSFSEEKYLDLIAPMPQSVNSLRVSADGSVLVTGSATEMIQVWHLGKIRNQLAAMNLNWGGEKTATVKTPSTRSSWADSNAALFLGLAGFGVVTALSLLTLNRHRTAIERFLAAERDAAQRNRELEVAKVELMHSQKMQALGTLAAGIAHDFNNLLSVIRMSNKLIGRETRAHAEIQENVADIEQAVLQGKNVVGSMLGYARNEEGAGKPTDVSAVVESGVSLLSKEFLSGIALTLELDREAPRVNVGRGQLEQVLLNLLVNASEAMQGQGKLKITVHLRHGLPPKPYVLRPGEAKEFVELSVIDSGPGVALEVLDRIFEPFFTTKRAGAQAGTGLGLSLVYSIAQQELLGLSVESDLGKGAEFSLVIPVNPAAPVREKHSSQNPVPTYTAE